MTLPDNNALYTLKCFFKADMPPSTATQPNSSAPVDVITRSEHCATQTTSGSRSMQEGAEQVATEVASVNLPDNETLREIIKDNNRILKDTIDYNTLASFLSETGDLSKWQLSKMKKKPENQDRISMVLEAVASSSTKKHPEICIRFFEYLIKYHSSLAERLLSGNYRS